MIDQRVPISDTLSAEILRKYNLESGDIGNVDRLPIPAVTTGGHFVHEFLYKGFPLTDQTLQTKIFAPFLNKIVDIGHVLEHLKNGLDHSLLMVDESIHNNIINNIGTGDIELFSRLQCYLVLLDTPNSVMVDVGGHAGYYTLFFKEFLESKKTYYFEMNEYASNCVKNRYINDPTVIVENYAVSDKEETTEYYISKSSQMHSIIPDDNTNTVKQTQAIRLDSYFTDEKIDLIKIDVEGAEIKVLKGMRGIVENIRFMLLETHHDEDWPELVDLLEEYNMDCIDLHTGKPTNPREGKKTHHCFCKNKTHKGNSFDFTIFRQEGEPTIRFNKKTMKFKDATENVKVWSMDEVLKTKGYERK